MSSMRSWTFDEPAPIADTSLRIEERARPEPEPDEVLVRVRACGVCRTDLHLVEGDLVPRRRGVTPGHQVVGDVVALGDRVTRFAMGDRVGIAWLRRTCGSCPWCRAGRENLCPYSLYTGWDADGGFADYATVPAAYAYEIPGDYTDEQAAPLLCAGIIGYRALRRAELPPGGRLGVYGFGASAHLATQVALAQGATVHVMTRAAEARQLALDLGAHSAGPADAMPPEPLDAAVLFAPAGGLVLPALAALDRGGTLAIAGIHLSDVPPLEYQRHLFQERQMRSVTANTRADGEEFLSLAERLGVQVTATSYPLDAADEALTDLANDRLTGAAVLVA